MKTHTLSLALALCAACCRGQSNTVYYGANSNELNVVFADAGLSESAQSNIVTDLNLCLQEWGKRAELRLWDGRDTAGYLYIGTVSPHYLDGIKFPRAVVETPGGVALRIPKELSDAYTNAFAFAAAHSNEVTAAYDFVAFVSSTNFPRIAPADLPDYLLSKKETPEELVANAQRNISDLGHQTYYPPSVLGFRYIPVGPGEPTASNLWVRIPCFSTPSTGWREWGGFPAIWHEGKWKFSFWMLEYPPS